MKNQSCPPSALPGCPCLCRYSFLRCCLHLPDYRSKRHGSYYCVPDSQSGICDFCTGRMGAFGREIICQRAYWLCPYVCSYFAGSDKSKTIFKEETIIGMPPYCQNRQSGGIPLYICFHILLCKISLMVCIDNRQKQFHPHTALIPFESFLRAVHFFCISSGALTLPKNQWQ